MRRVELPNNTPEQVREYVTQSIEVADDLAPEGSAAWVAVFNAAFQGFSGKQIMLEQPAPLDLSPYRNGGRR